MTINAAKKLFPRMQFLMELAKVRCGGGNMLANIGRDQMEQDEVWRLFGEMETWMKSNQESIFGINGGGPWPERCNVPVTIKDQFGISMHAKHATQANPIVLRECPDIRRIAHCEPEPIPYAFDQQTFRLSIPEAMKATNVTDVVKVEFGNDVDPEPIFSSIGDRVEKSDVKRPDHVKVLSSTLIKAELSI